MRVKVITLILPYFFRLRTAKYALFSLHYKIMEMPKFSKKKSPV